MSVDYGGSGGDGDNVDNPYDGDDDDSGGDSSGGDSSGGDSSGGYLWENVAPNWMRDGSTVLRTFASNPRNFIIGAVSATILETVFGVVTTVLNQLILIFAGSAPGTLNAPGETLGLIDVPVAIADSLGDAGGGVGTAIIDAINSVNEPIFELAGSAGLISPLIIVSAVVVEGVAVIWLFQRLVYVVADWLQLGGLTE